MCLFKPSMAELPAHIVVDILSRLPAKTILHCRSVCKTWCNLLSDSYFANLHLSRSPASLMIHHISEKLGYEGAHPGILKLVEIEDEPSHHTFHHDPVMSLDLRLGVAFQKSQVLLVSSVNGLLCLWQYNLGKDNIYISNPITREYMMLPKQENCREFYTVILYGFGCSSLTGQYKVIRIFQGGNPPNQTSTSCSRLLEVEIYTLGTGTWRSLGHVPFRLAGFHSTFLNSYLHWFVFYRESPEKICSFDIERESFPLVPSPPTNRGADKLHQSLLVLGGCLCECDSSDSELVIWVMKEYGIRKSSTKEIVIQANNPRGLDWLELQMLMC